MQVRPWTYFEKGVVGHVGFADPFDNALRAIVIEAVQGKGVMQGESVQLHEDGTLICMGKLLIPSSPLSSSYSPLSSLDLEFTLVPPLARIRHPQLLTHPLPTSHSQSHPFTQPLPPLLKPYLQKDPNSPPAPNPTSTAPGPAPASTCPASPKPNSPAKPSSPTL